LDNKKIIKALSQSQTPVETFEKISGVKVSALGSKVLKKLSKDIVLEVITKIKLSRVKPAIALIQALFALLGADEALDQIKRSGVLRASKYQFNVAGLRPVISQFINNASALGIQSADLTFINSAYLLYDLCPALYQLRQSIIERLKQNKFYALKSMLAELDLRFCYGNTQRTNALGLSEGLSAEEVSEAYSYLLYLFNSEIGLKGEHLGFTDPEVGHKSTYLELLNDAASLCEYKEVEVLIESFPYRAKSTSKGIVVEAIEPSLEKSVRLGYMQTEMQLGIRREAFSYHKENNKKIASLNKIAEKVFSRTRDKFVKLITEPIPRYVLMLPKHESIGKFFSEDGVFLEDLSALEFLATEDYVSKKDVSELKVVGNIRVLDILKVQRLMRFAQIGLTHATHQHTPVAEQVNLQLASIVPVYKCKMLVEIVQNAVGGKAQEIIDFLTCQFDEDYVDIQYTPIIKAGDYYMLSMSVFTGSNLVRNLLSHHSKRLALKDPEGNDYMQTRLMESLRNAGFLVQDEFEAGTVANRRETDLIAYKDGRLFLFECKNTYHPCNVFERRTSYQYICYASHQLTLRKEWLSDKVRQVEAFKKLGWDVSPTNDISTCIALGTRVFNGYELNGHPVRSVHEMLNVLDSGIVAIGERRYRLWKSEAFHVEDLLWYLSANGPVKDFSDAMIRAHRSVKIGDTGFLFDTFVLDSEKLGEIIESRYAAATSVISEE